MNKEKNRMDEKNVNVSDPKKALFETKGVFEIHQLVNDTLTDGTIEDEGERNESRKSR